MTKNFYLTRIGKIWYVRFRDPTTRVIQSAQSSGLTNKTEAENWARKQYDRLCYLTGDAGMPFEEWADRFFRPDCPHVIRVRLEGKPYSEATRKHNRKILEKYILTDPIVQKYVGDIKKADVIAFRARLVAKIGQTRTAQLTYSVFRTIISETLYLGVISSDPCSGVKKIAYKSKTRPVLRLNQALELLDRRNWKNTAHWEMTLTAALTGMRAGEVRGLCWDAIDPKNNVIHVIRNIPCKSNIVKAPKWEKTRITVYPAVLKAVLEPRRAKGFVWELNGKALGYSRWANEFRDICHGAISLHGLRHTLHTALRDAGIPDDKLRAMFGWSAPNVQDGYTHRELYDNSQQLELIDLLTKDKIENSSGRDDSSDTPDPHFNGLPPKLLGN